jgi:tetratricopeptide (TPR) repeat protein
MNKLKVCVYSVCKDEEKFVDRWVDSMSEADIIVVTDTGSTDNTVQKLKDRGVITYVNVIKPWRFDKARNVTLPKIPEDVDICVSTDLDEVFQSGWRENLERAWTKGTTRAKYHYTWNFMPNGEPGITFYQDRIHARHGYKWVNPTHECLEYIGDGIEKYAWCSDVKLEHYPDMTKDRSFNLPLLKIAVSERPKDPRNYHYLGREYMFAGMWDECIDTLKKHLALPNSNWDAERSASMRFIARGHKAQNNILQAKSWLYKAMGETPGSREPYVEMAKLMYEQKEWAGIYHMVTEVLKIKERSTYINETWCWDYTIYDLGSLACYYLGLKEKALEFAKIALDMEEDNERLKNNYDIISNSLANNDD